MHLHKEIQELQLENKLLQAKFMPTLYPNGHAHVGDDGHAKLPFILFAIDDDGRGKRCAPAREGYPTK